MIQIAKNTGIYRFNDSITYFIVSVNSYYCFVSNFTMNNPKLISITKYSTLYNFFQTILSNPRDLPILAIQNYLQDTLTKYFAWNVTVGMKHLTAAGKTWSWNNWFCEDGHQSQNCDCPIVMFNCHFLILISPSSIFSWCTQPST